MAHAGRRRGTRTPMLIRSVRASQRHTLPLGALSASSPICIHRPHLVGRVLAEGAASQTPQLPWDPTQRFNRHNSIDHRPINRQFSNTN
eukprot:4423673-Pyramimonas_sp.AAC.2